MRRQAGSAPSGVWFTQNVSPATDADDRATQLVAGRLLQRLSLTATSGGVALQHMNHITERIDAKRAGGAPATFGPRFAELLPPGAAPLVVFRVGYPTPHSPSWGPSRSP